jgi:hypothetical protein
MAREIVLARDFVLRSIEDGLSQVFSEAKLEKNIPLGTNCEITSHRTRPGGRAGQN